MPNATMNLNSTLSGQNNSGTGNALARNEINSRVNLNLSTGSGSNQVADILVQAGTVASGTPVSIDVVGGLAPPVGSAPTPTRIVALRVVNKSTTAGQTLQIGGGSNAITTIMGGTTPILNVGPGGFVDIASPVDGFALTAGTADRLQIASSSGSIDYEVYVAVR